jgi:hypothetical protein
MRIRRSRGQREYAYAMLCAKQNLENKKPAVFRRRLGGDEESKCPGESSIKSSGYERWTLQLREVDITSRLKQLNHPIPIMSIEDNFETVIVFVVPIQYCVTQNF